MPATRCCTTHMHAQLNEQDCTYKDTRTHNLRCHFLEWHQAVVLVISPSVELEVSRLVEVIIMDAPFTKRDVRMSKDVLNSKQFQAFNARASSYFSVFVDMMIKVLDIRQASNLSQHIGPKLSYSFVAQQHCVKRIAAFIVSFR